MTETKCKLCGELRSCREAWSYNFCKDCFDARIIIFSGKNLGVFVKLIERIERFENMMPDILLDFEKRLEKLESKNDRNIS